MCRGWDQTNCTKGRDNFWLNVRLMQSRPRKNSECRIANNKERGRKLAEKFYPIITYTFDN